MRPWPRPGRWRSSAPITAGAHPDTVQVIDVEEIPLTYLPSNALRIRVKAVGDLHLAG